MKPIKDSTELNGVLFEDTIDGYFPLHDSLRQMLSRNGFTSAIVSLTFAPIMHIPNLPHDAPVPLNSESGFTGLIESLSVCVSSTTMCGLGTWHWLVDDADNSLNASTLDSMTRLAEPCYLTGCGFRTADISAALLDAASCGQKNGNKNGNKNRDKKRNNTRSDDGNACSGNACSGNTFIVRELPLISKQAFSVWGPFQQANIHCVDATVAMHGNHVSESMASADGLYVVTYK